MGVFAKLFSGGHAEGGLISGPGTGTSDSVVARVSAGEFVVRADATKRNLPLLHAINSGVPAFADGGLVGRPSISSVSGNVTNHVNNVTVNTNGGGSPMWTSKNRGRYDRSKLRYPSDLTDDEWRPVEPLIPPGRRGGGKRTVIMREVMNGLMYVLSTGCQWRAIPNDLPPKSTIYDYFDLWTYDGTLERIHHALYEQCREQAQREVSPTAAIIDSQSVKSAEKDTMGEAARQI
jgi:transposase